MITNYTEVAVEELFPLVLDDYVKKNTSVCVCEQCLNDIKALALITLPPHYTTRDRGAILQKVNFDLVGGKAMIISAIITAIQHVARNPRHYK